MIIVYSKNPVESCPFCVNAIALLKERNIEHEVYKVGTHFEREWIQRAYPTMKTYPVVVERTEEGAPPLAKYKFELIGGYTELKAKIDG